MAELKTLNGYEIVDAKAREDIEQLQEDIEQTGAAIPTVPDKVSAFENDAGYITEHQDISGKADKAHTHTLAEVTDYKEPDFTGYATETYVDNAIEAIDFPETDLSNYYTKAETHQQLANNIPAYIPSLVSAFENDMGYVTEESLETLSFDNYYTKEEVDTAHSVLQSSISNVEVLAATTRTDLANDYYTKTETDSAIKTAVDAIDIPEVDFTGYATEQYVDNKVSNVTQLAISNQEKIIDLQEAGYATEDYVAQAIAGVVQPEPDLSNYYTKSEVDDKDTAINSQLATTKLTADNAYTLAYQANNAGYITNKALEGYATEDYVDDAIQAVNNIDLSNYYTKTEVDGLIPNTDSFATKSYVDEAIEVAIPDVSQYQTEAQVQALINQALGVIENGTY